MALTVMVIRQLMAESGVEPAAGGELDRSRVDAVLNKQVLPSVSELVEGAQGDLRVSPDREVPEPDEPGSAGESSVGR